MFGGVRSSSPGLDEAPSLMADVANVSLKGTSMSNLVMSPTTAFPTRMTSLAASSIALLS